MLSTGIWSNVDLRPTAKTDAEYVIGELRSLG